MFLTVNKKEKKSFLSLIILIHVGILYTGKFFLTAESLRTNAVDITRFLCLSTSRMYGRVLGPGTYFFLFCRVSRNFDLLTRKFDILSRKFDLVSRNFDLLTRKFDIGRIFELMSKFRDTKSNFRVNKSKFRDTLQNKKDIYLALILFRTYVYGFKRLLLWSHFGFEMARRNIKD